MRAIAEDEFGGPANLMNLPIPEIEADEVLIRVRAAERGEDLAVDPEVGMAHVRPLLRAGKGEGDAAKVVGRGHRSKLTQPGDRMNALAPRGPRP